ncbi:hypothetical protein LSUE1_G008720, partial [Lachnellula suecica]
MENGQYVDGSLWFYAPNKAAPVVFALAFLISGLIHTYQCMQQHRRYKCWKVTGILPWSALLFVVGYILREIGAFNFGNVNIFISSIVFIYAAPPQSNQDTGKALLKTALVLQLVVLSLFVFLAAYFHRQCKRARILPENLKKVLGTLYVSSALIGIRTIYRTVEYFSTAELHFTSDTDPSTFSPILRYEWFFWVFEGSLMVLNSFMLNARHPMRFLPRSNKVYLAQDGVTEVEGEGYRDRRMWVLTVLDPFDVV